MRLVNTINYLKYQHFNRGDNSYDLWDIKIFLQQDFYRFRCLIKPKTMLETTAVKFNEYM